MRIDLCSNYKMLPRLWNSWNLQPENKRALENRCRSAALMEGAQARLNENVWCSSLSKPPEAKMPEAQAEGGCSRTRSLWPSADVSLRPTSNDELKGQSNVNTRNSIWWLAVEHTFTGILPGVTWWNWWALLGSRNRSSYGPAGLVFLFSWLD